MDGQIQCAGPRLGLAKTTWSGLEKIRPIWTFFIGEDGL